MHCPKCLVGVVPVLVPGDGTAVYNHESGEVDVELEVMLTCPTCGEGLSRTTHHEGFEVKPTEIQAHAECFLEDGDYLGEPDYTESVIVKGPRPEAQVLPWESCLVEVHIQITCDNCKGVITLKEQAKILRTSFCC